MVVLEVRQQLEHSVTLLLEVVLDLPKGIFESLVFHVFLVHLLQELAQFRAQLKHILQCLEHIGQVQEALFQDGVLVLIMEHSALLEVS